MEDQPLSLWEHLNELRRRIVYSLWSVVLAFLVAWFFRRDVLFLLKKPLLDALPESMRHTVLLGLMDKMFIDLRLALIGALFLSAPFVIYQVWAFISPGLYRHEKRIAKPVLVASLALFALGVVFAYLVILPIIFDFLVTYSLAPEDLTLVGSAGANAPGDALQIALDRHISFTATFLFLFGLSFETPLVMLLLDRIGFVSAKWFARQRRYAIVVIFILAAVLTPPDPWSQVSMGIPMIILYEVGIWITRLLPKTAPSSEPEAEPEANRDDPS